MKGQPQASRINFIALDSVNLDNDNLTSEIKEYKESLKQLLTENVLLKNENEKYKIALKLDHKTKKRRNL